MNDFELNDLAEGDQNKVADRLNLIEFTLDKYQEQCDNETLVKVTNYLHPAQIHFLDEVAEKQGLSQGNKRVAGSRSAALRYILDQVQKND